MIGRVCRAVREAVRQSHDRHSLLRQVTGPVADKGRCHCEGVTGVRCADTLTARGRCTACRNYCA